MPNAHLDLVTTKQAAALLSASRTSVQRWIDSGTLRAFKTPGGHRRITREDLAAFLRRQGAPVPGELRTQLHVIVLDADERFTRALESQLKTLERTVSISAYHSAIDGLLHLGGGEADAVLVSTSLPDLDVATLARRFRRLPGGALPLFALLPGEDRRTAARLKQSNITSVLTKPLDGSGLVAALHAAGLMEPQPE